MDWYPLWNSLRIAGISCVIVFFLGIGAAYYVAKLPRFMKAVVDVVLTLPSCCRQRFAAGYFSSSLVLTILSDRCCNNGDSNSS